MPFQPTCCNKMDKHMDNSDHSAPKNNLPKYLLTVFLGFAYFGLGICSYILGPTLVHLMYLYDTDIARMSISFIFQFAGILSGSLLCGILFDRYNHEIQLCSACVILGSATVAAPWFPYIYGFYIIIMVANLARGYMASSIQSYVIRLWSNHKYQHSIIQGMNSTVSFGAFVCPFLVTPFLAKLPDSEHANNTTKVSHHTNVTKTIINNNISNIKYNFTNRIKDTINEVPDDMPNVRYAYLVTGMVPFVTSLVLLIVLCKLKSKSLVSVRKDIRTPKQTYVFSNKSTFKIPSLIMLFSFYFIYAWYETIPSGLLSAFVIKGLGWDVSYGPMMTSLFFCSIAFGRLSGIPLSTLLSPVKMLMYSLLVTTAAFVLMRFAPVNHNSLMWISTFLAGFGMGTTFGSGALWISTYIPVTGVVASLFYIGISFGGMAAGATGGYLFEYDSHMWVIYLPLIACFVHMLLCTVMFLFIKWHVKYRSILTLSLNVDQSERKGLKI